MKTSCNKKMCNHILYNDTSKEHYIDVRWVRKNVYYCQQCGMKLHQLEIDFLKQKLYYLNTPEEEQSNLRLLMKDRVEINQPIPRPY